MQTYNITILDSFVQQIDITIEIDDQMWSQQMVDSVVS